MKKIVPFRKEISFKTNVSEITSISLEHDLHLEESEIRGNFTLSGEYKMNDTSVNVEGFHYDLPFQIALDEKYILDSVVCDIDDFYYEIVNDNILSISIDVLIDKLEEKPLMETRECIESDDVLPTVEKESTERLEKEESVEEVFEEKREIQTERDRKMDIQEALSVESTVPEVKSIFDSFDDKMENYASYKVYIVREEDTIESILVKYTIAREELEKYNNLKEIKIGDKLIIPSK